MRNKIIRYGIAIICFGVLAGIGIASYLFNKPKRNISTINAEYSLTATQLLTEFTQNEPAANAKYLSDANGKVIQVSGSIGEIVLQDDTVCTLFLKEIATSNGGISCSMEKAEITKARLLKVGTKVMLKGECIGYLEITNEVLIVRCILEKE